jgi:hypothetical protein
MLEVRTRNQAAVAVVRKVNPITRGWAGVFHFGNSTRVFGQQQTLVRHRLRRWLWRKSIAAPTGCSVSSPTTDWQANTR